MTLEHTTAHVLSATREISNSDDVIDSRDVIERIAELEDLAPPAEEDDGTFNEERAELAALKALADEAECYSPDWTYGSTLIRRSYFVDYCEELVKDIARHTIAPCLVDIIGV